MVKLPQLNQGEKEIQNTTTFLGYNHNEIIRDGELYYTKNLSGDKYPLLTVRKKRGYTSFDIAGSTDKLSGINGRDQLTFVLGTDVYYNFVKVTGLSVSDDVADCPKTIVNFGAYVLIFPDKKYFNTVDQTDFGSMERLWPATGSGITGANVSLTMCRGDGTDYDMTQITVDEDPPADPENGEFWVDTSGDNDVLRQYAYSTGEWVEVATVYVKISATGIGSGLKNYDAIELSGLEAVSTASDRVKAQVAALNGSFLVYFRGENYIVVQGIISQTQAALKDQAVRADLKIPQMDHIVESNNRLWGCTYGLVGGKVVNEIRCSALGDFRNWNRFMQNSQDSWVAQVGTDGPFTAAVTQKGYPVFFKENCVHQVYGAVPTSFQINTQVCRGVQEGSGKSAVVVNEQVYYKSRTDVMMFDGSLPVSVSAQLGGVLYSQARAGAIGGKYYINMKDKSGKWHLFTYDTETGVWFREDNFKAMGFGRVNDELFAIEEETNKLVSMCGSVGEPEDDFPWVAEFGLFGTDYRGKKYLSRFDIRMYLENGTRAELEIQYDSSGEWEKMGTIKGNRLRTFVMPVVPRRCDHLRFRLSGEGDMRIYSISRIMEGSSDA